jgi:phosphoribosylamine---glycine ligase
VIEELLEGPEISVFALCDGATCLALPVAQDFKRAEDGDAGPNTGGMGSFSPVPGFDAEAIEALVDLTCRPILAELAERDHPFIGTLFAGLMLTPDGPRVLEYNCRFGDPETQSLMPLIEGDLLEALVACAAGELGGVALERSTGAAVTVVLAAGDYPARSDTGSPISGIGSAEATGALVFHAGTALRDGAVVTNGGRILNVTGVGDDIGAARAAAYAAADLIAWDGVRRREDIALAASRGGTKQTG